MQAIYHLAPAERWRDWPAGQPYLPAEYAADGFVHCTAGPALMLRVANRFYRSVPSAFVVLEIDPARLTAPLKWEASPDDLAPAFPHIYGSIDRAAIMAAHAVRRAADGEFLGW